MSSLPPKETPLQESTARQARKQAHLIPDAMFIRGRIPIQDVARELGLEVNGRQAHCWRIEAHRNGDSNPSIWFDRKNRGRCQVCDAQARSNIDFVMMILGLNTADAIRWIAQRFEVPRLPKGKHLVENQRWNPRFRVGTGDTFMETFVRSGLLAALTGAEAKVLEVLRAFADNNGRAVISYLGIMRYTGIASAATVRTGPEVFFEGMWIRSARSLRSPRGVALGDPSIQRPETA